MLFLLFFFFQAEDGIRDHCVTGVQTCALPIFGCTVGPKYQRASAPVPAKWDVTEPWRESAPKDGVAKGEWWSVFESDELSALETQTLDANQTIQVAVARLEQARAAAALEVATRVPKLSTSPSAERQRLSGNRPSRDRKSTRLNSSHTVISYAVFCLKKKKK